MKYTTKLMIGGGALFVMFVILLNLSNSNVSSAAVAEVNRSTQQRNVMVTSQNQSGFNKYVDSL
jgi:hypothetical protein